MARSGVAHGSRKARARLVPGAFPSHCKSSSPWKPLFHPTIDSAREERLTALFDYDVGGAPRRRIKEQKPSSP
ncbi:WASP-associated protein with actin, membranes and microtubules-like protein [Corchorus olitorius]|uniref:WASP-associated protein with actin, membranes and microtubules-like protein n=1 Tax=Corchorus olitorius TaxID=93759 RepID=A0A1R3GHE0_9ROSI|nr:WASP-associated protein with actin, membranes and microtubules-like protein [Corchorus olitorius]